MVSVEDTLVIVLTVLSVGVDAVVGDTVVNVLGVLVVSVIDREAHSFVLQCGGVTTELKVTEIWIQHLKKPPTTVADVNPGI